MLVFIKSILKKQVSGKDSRKLLNMSSGDFLKTMKKITKFKLIFRLNFPIFFI